jgi:hypothetical protein
VLRLVRADLETPVAIQHSDLLPHMAVAVDLETAETQAAVVEVESTLLDRMGSILDPMRQEALSAAVLDPSVAPEAAVHPCGVVAAVAAEVPEVKAEERSTAEVAEGTEIMGPEAQRLDLVAMGEPVQTL